MLKSLAALAIFAILGVLVIGLPPVREARLVIARLARGWIEQF